MLPFSSHLFQFRFLPSTRQRLSQHLQQNTQLWYKNVFLTLIIALFCTCFFKNVRFERVRLITARHRKTPQDTARHRKTPQDTARHLQDTARDLKKDAWKVIIDIQGCGGGGGRGRGGGWSCHKIIWENIFIAFLHEL